jgi:flagellar FliL protein
MAVDEKPEDAKGSAAHEAAPAKAKSALVPTLILSVVMAGAGYAAAAFVLKPMLGGAPAAVTETHEAAPAQAKGEIVSFTNIIVNPSGTMGSRYLNVSVGLEVPDPETRHAVEGREPRIKDALITELSSRTMEELTQPAMREEIRAAIQARIDEQVAPHRVTAVYFLDFVLQ